ncbi:hypothetical protein JA1_001885 [Spathaspora sp. JA1]|nr:hypothetical protein JA1_001885 [Spathaspora sp. JA1]
MEKETEERDVLGNTIYTSHITENTNWESHHKSNINELPTELLIAIFSQLDPVYLNLIRLVCKRWNFVINDRETWTNAFTNKFHTPKIFPSLSSNCMTEYFMRLNIIKNWKKGHAIHSFYQLINNEYRFNDLTRCDFTQDRIMIFSKRHGNITSGNLHSGRNQSYIPGGSNLNISCVAMNGNYLLMGKLNGEVHLKNLVTSTSVSSRSSYQVFSSGEQQDLPVMCVCMNDNPDKFKTRVDAITGGYNGIVKCWNFQGKLVKSFQFEQQIVYNVASDFQKYIILNTDSKLVIIDYQSLEIVHELDLGLTIENTEDPNNASYFQNLIQSKNKLDVDYVDKNIIICYDTIIKVFNFESGIRQRQLDLKTSIVKSYLQTCSEHKLLSNNSRNRTIIGSDGLLYVNLLADDSVIIWNVREDSSKIEPIVHIQPSLNYMKYSPMLHDAIVQRDLPYIVDIAITSTILAVCGYNGLCNIYDVYTGKFLREISLKFPKKFEHMHDRLIGDVYIKLNPNQIDCNGVIVCGDTVQYFQFGDLQPVNLSKTKKQKSINLGVHSKHESKKKIKDGMDEYTSQKYNQKMTHALLDKYNGTQYDDEDEELSIALAISQSYQNSSKGESDSSEFIDPSLDDDLLLAIELSKQEKEAEEEEARRNEELAFHEPIQMSSRQEERLNDEEIEELRKALELSLLEH